VSKKDKREARASILPFMLIISFDIWLLASESMPWGFEGFDLTNPRGQLVGERFHLSCSKIVLEDAILHPHHSTVITGTINHPGEQQVVPLRVSRRGGASLCEGSSIQEIGRTSGDSSTWVFVAGPWSSVLVHFERGNLAR
jgi:hypothetical protein